MSTFKDIIIQDLAVFINVDEFGEVHDINGRQLTVVIDDSGLSESPGLTERTGGIYIGMLKVYIKETDLETIPVIGEVFRLDGELYLVKNVAKPGGITEITLEANEI